MNLNFINIYWPKICIHFLFLLFAYLNCFTLKVLLNNLKYIPPPHVRTLPDSFIEGFNTLSECMIYILNALTTIIDNNPVNIFQRNYLQCLVIFNDILFK